MLRTRRRPVHGPIDLNVIPLIDVVFFLLIFDVISTSFVQESAVRLDRPASAGATPVNGGFTAVAVLPGGLVQIGAQVTEVCGLEHALRPVLEGAATRTVLVIPDRSVPTGLLLTVMDACTAAGATSVEVAATADPR